MAHKNLAPDDKGGSLKLRKLGKNGPNISVVGYGAWEIGGEAYGPNPSTNKVVEAIHSALDAGINWIDTAEVYGKGRSEELVAKALKGRRDQVVVASKVAPGPPGSGYGPDEVRGAIKKSLQRLEIDHLDLYQLHWKPDEDFPIEETWGTMAELVDEGLTRFIGVSNFDRGLIERCLKIRHCDSLQPQYSMLHRDGEDLFQWCGANGVGVIAYGPLAYGLLSGTIDESTNFDPSDWRSGKWPDHPYYVELFAKDVLPVRLKTVESLRPVADRLGMTLGQLAIAWTFHQNSVTAAISGSRNPMHNQENARAGDVELANDVLEEIDKLISL